MTEKQRKTILEADFYLSRLSDNYWSKYENSGNEHFQNEYHDIHRVKQELQEILRS